MLFVEEYARGEGKEMLTLSCAVGGEAERLYRKLGWEVWGLCSGSARAPGGERCDVVFLRGN